MKFELNSNINTSFSVITVSYFWDTEIWSRSLKVGMNRCNSTRSTIMQSSTFVASQKIPRFKGSNKPKHLTPPFNIHQSHKYCAWPFLMYVASYNDWTTAGKNPKQNLYIYISITPVTSKQGQGHKPRVTCRPQGIIIVQNLMDLVLMVYKNKANVSFFQMRKNGNYLL